MSPFSENGKVWMNGQLIAWKDARIHIASHVVHYGSSLFEGFRAYETPRGTAVFRLEAHIKRLFNSCKMYRMDVPYTIAEFNQAVLETVRANGLKSCYIRPIIYRGYNALGVDPFSGVFRHHQRQTGRYISLADLYLSEVKNGSR